VGRNARQDSSNNNNALNNNSCSSPAKRRITATTAMVAAVAAVGVAPPTPLPPRVYGLPTSTPGSAPFRCGRASRGGGGWRPVASPASVGYAGRHSSLRSSAVGRLTLHASTRASAHSSWSAAGSSTVGSGSMVPMDGLMRSTIVGQLLQHHVHGLSCIHRLGG
jgi:hypothetical protein